jgi:hypothetical protein
VIRSPARDIRVSFRSGVSIFGTKHWQRHCTSGLCEEYYERFQLIFLLPLISSEYPFVGFFAQHCAQSLCFRHLSKLAVARIAASRKRLCHFSALSHAPSIVMSEGDSYSRTQNFYVHTFFSRHFQMRRTINPQEQISSWQWPIPKIWIQSPKCRVCKWKTDG